MGTMREVGASMERDALWGALLLAPLEIIGVESLDRRGGDRPREVQDAAAQSGQGGQRAAPPPDDRVRRPRHQAVRLRPSMRLSVPGTDRSSVRSGKVPSHAHFSSRAVPRSPRAGRAVGDRTDVLGSGRLQEAAERPARGDQREPRGAGRGRRADVPHRLPHRAERPHRLRAPVRAPDVPGLRARRQVRARPHRQRERRHAERLDAVRSHQLLRGDAVQRARAGDVARGGPHARR